MIINDCRVELKWSCARYAPVEHLDMDGIQFLAFSAYVVPERLGNKLVDMSLNQFSHLFIDGFINSHLHFVWWTWIRFAYPPQSLELLTFFFELFYDFSAEDRFQ